MMRKMPSHLSAIDGDRLVDEQEYKHELNPMNTDSDGDGQEDLYDVYPDGLQTPPERPIIF